MATRQIPNRSDLAKLARGDETMIRALEALFAVVGESETDLTAYSAVQAVWAGASLATDDDQDLPTIVADGTLLHVGGSLVRRIRNTSGAAISKGDGVMRTGASASVTTGAAAVANGTYDRMLGIAGEDIANNTEGFVVVAGLLSGVDTSAWVVGTPLYFDATTPGDLTSTQPDAPNLRAEQAFVVAQNASNGVLFVCAQDRATVEALNVYVPAIADGDRLQWDAANSRWIVGTGWSGTFINGDGDTVTVSKGIITNVA